MQTSNETLGNDAARYRGMRKLAMLPDPKRDLVLARMGEFDDAKTEQEFDGQADALIAMLHELFADEIQGDASFSEPAAFLELDPTHTQGCCGKCAGNCPPEAGWGPSDKTD